MRTVLVLQASAFAAALSSLPAISHAQGNRIADEGSFTISINGRTIGRENFRITATTRGDVAEYVARADVTYGDRKISPELHTGPQGAVLTYDVTTRSGGSNESWKGAVTRGRLNATIASGRGTAAREYMVPQDALVLDDDIVHHHWFLVLRSRDGSMPVVTPRGSNIKSSVTMSTVGEETLQIGSHNVPAVHLRATSADGDVHDVWVDKSGRLLKLAIPSKGLVAVRDDPPPA